MRSGHKNVGRVVGTARIANILKTCHRSFFSKMQKSCITYIYIYIYNIYICIYTKIRNLLSPLLYIQCILLREHEGTERDTTSPRFVIFRLVLKRKYVFRDVHTKTNLDLMWLVCK